MAQDENIREKWLRQLAVLRDEIAAMPDGPERTAARRRAQQLENATQIENWIRPKSPERSER
jgi:hypothetical protein